MATLERIWAPRAQEEQTQRRQESVTAHDEITIGTASAAVISSGASIFPVAPTHDPRIRQEVAIVAKGNQEEAAPGSHGQGDEEEEEEKEEREDEIEEVLEELQDDEIEEMADEGWGSYDSLSNLLDQEMETTALLSAAQFVCIATIQSLLRSLSCSTSQTAMLGGKEAVDTLIRASDDAATSTLAAKTSAGPATASSVNGSQTGAARPIDRLSSLLDHAIVAGLSADGAEDSSLLTALKDVVAAINATNLTVDEQVLADFYLETASPTTSQNSSISPGDLASPASYSQQQQTRPPWVTASSRTVPSSSLAGSSPSISREELRNPFMDSDLRPQSSLSEDRHRDRTDREADTFLRLVKIMDSLNKRCTEVVASFDWPAQRVKARGAIDSEDHLPDKSLHEEVVKTWTNLQSLSKNAQELLVNRRIQALNADLRRKSGSPVSYSPSYSPSRGRSRRNSVTSLNSQPASLGSLEAGDPTGEAVAAGVGVGATRSLSRLSSPSTRNPPGVSASHPSPLVGSLLSRRGSTKSEGTASYSVHSPPPRYSEDSVRLWSTGSREAETALHEGVRSARTSSDHHSSLSTRTLPAYNTTDAAYQSTLDKKDSSSSSLTRFDSNTRSTKMDGGSERSRSASDTANMVVNSQHRAQSSISTSTSEHQARTSQDLNMVQTSIDRLYSAVPQLNDQRVSSPTDAKQRQAQKRDEMLQLVERLSKGGRMEDQRAMPPAESSHRQSVASSPYSAGEGASTLTSAPSAPMNGRLAKRLGSISFSSLSLRRAASVLGSESKGKEKERTVDGLETLSSASSRADLDDLLPLAAQVQAATDRGYEDQRAQVRAKPRTARKPSKLDLMGVSTFNETSKARDEADDDLFDVLSASLSSSRMSDQDAVRRPSPFTQTSSSSIGQLPSPSYTSSPRTPLRRKQTIESAPTSNGLHSPLQVGESMQASKDSSGGRTNDSTRNLRDSRGMSISQGLPGNLMSGSVSRKQTVRRKPVPHEESAGLSYIAESQAQLGFVSVSLWMVMTPASDILSYQVDINNFQVLLVSHDGVSHSVALPCQVVEGQEGSVARLQDHWQVKLQMEETLARARGVMHARQAAAPLSASTLQDMRPSQFVCDSCLQTVAETRSITQYLPLPSQHWEELIDAWMCHTDQELSQGMIDTQKRLDEHRGLQAEQARVADSFIVIHPSQLVAAGTYEDVQRIHCNACKGVLGHWASPCAVKLFKYAVRARSLHQPLPPSTLGMVIANDLIRLSQAHATRHFIIQDDEGREHLRLWLFLDSFDLAVGACSPDRHDAFTACKIMYRDPVATMPVVQAAQAWAQPDLVEAVPYPNKVCQQLALLIQQSTLAYPPTRRHFTADWTVAFLQTS